MYSALVRPARTYILEMMPIPGKLQMKEPGRMSGPFIKWIV